MIFWDFGFFFAFTFCGFREEAAVRSLSSCAKSVTMARPRRWDDALVFFFAFFPRFLASAPGCFFPWRRDMRDSPSWILMTLIRVGSRLCDVFFAFPNPLTAIRVCATAIGSLGLLADNTIHPRDFTPGFGVNWRTMDVLCRALSWMSDGVTTLNELSSGLLAGLPEEISATRQRTDRSTSTMLRIEPIASDVIPCATEPNCTSFCWGTITAGAVGFAAALPFPSFPTITISCLPPWVASRTNLARSAYCFPRRMIRSAPFMGAYKILMASVWEGGRLIVVESQLNDKHAFGNRFIGNILARMDMVLHPPLCTGKSKKVAFPAHEASVTLLRPGGTCKQFLGATTTLTGTRADISSTSWAPLFCDGIDCMLNSQL